MPKSVTFARPSWFTSTFCGFTSRWTSLMATQRSSVSSKARYTVDMPPDPRRSSRRKRPLRRVPITGRLFWRLVPVRVRYLTDPVCPASWAHEPVIRGLEREFGEGLAWTYVMGGLAREFGPSEGQSESLAPAPAGTERLLVEWLETAAAAGMPCHPLLWRDGALRAGHPACLSVKAATEQGTAAAGAYLRSVREGLFCFRRKLDTTEALVEEARRAGLDVERFRSDLASHATVEAFGADLDEARAVPDEARAQG